MTRGGLRQRNRYAGLLAAVICVGAIGVSPALADLSFQGLGVGTYAHAVSADGTTVVGQGSDWQAFSWTSTGGMVGLGGLNGQASNAYAVSANGSVVVGTSNSTAFRWTTEGGMEAIADSTQTYAAYGVSADGQVVVGEGQGKGFRWTESGGLELLPYTTHAYAVSADGSTVVGKWSGETGYVVHGFRLKDGVMTDLGDSYFYGFANAVSADGSVVVGGCNLNVFRWTDAAVGLDILSIPLSGVSNDEPFSLDLSADGAIMVGTTSFYGEGGGLESKAFIWDEVNNMRYIEDLLQSYGLATGWSLTNAGGISADGLTIVGYGYNPEGQQEAWIATLANPVPVPGAALLGVIGLGFAGWRLKRRTSAS